MPSLKRQSDFRRLREEGRFLHVNHWLAISFQNKNCNQSLNWAWTVSKKVGSAVVRNRLKRWGRDLVKDVDEIKTDVNFIFKIKGKDFYKNLSRQEFDHAFRKAFKKIS